MSIEQPVAPEPVSLEQRRAILQQAIGIELQGGGTVVHQTDTWVVVSYGKEPQHLLHALLSLLTCGLWLIVWFFAAVSGGEKRRTFAVDEAGVVQVTGWDAHTYGPR